MSRKTRVYGGLVLRNGKQIRCVVAGTQDDVCKAVGVTKHNVRGWWAETGNEREVYLATQTPRCAVFPDDP